jgi:hypothetical protein
MEKRREIRIEKKFLFVIMLFSLTLLFSLNVFAEQFNNPQQAQFSAPDLNQYYSRIGFNYNEIWTNFNSPDTCEATQDFIVNIRPGSCTPAVVRSDLLEEQNVPVFCQLDATKINPLISTDKIKRVYIKTNNQSSAIAGASYYPSKSAIGAHQTTIDNPIFTDIGYVVVNIKKMNEGDMPDSVTANLTAVIEYDIENAFGIGQSIFYLPVLEEEEWNSDYNSYGFWKGRGFLRLEYVDENEARVSIYSDKNNLYKSIVVKKGQTSEIIFMPGFYCQAGLKINFLGQEIPKERALLDINGVAGWVVEDEKLENGCVINEVDNDKDQVTITCRGKKQTLSIGFSDYVKINSVNTRVGNVLNAQKNDYLLFYGIHNQEDVKNDFVVIASGISDAYIENSRIKQTKLDNVKKIINSKLDTKKLKYDAFVSQIKQEISKEFGLNSEKIIIVKQGKQEGEYTFDDIVIIEREKEDYGEEGEKVEDYFNEAKKSAYEIVDVYGDEKEVDELGYAGEYYGAKALYELSETAGTIGKQETQLEILKKIIEKYPDSQLSTKSQTDIETLGGHDYSASTGFFEIDNQNIIMSLKDVKAPGKDEASADFDVSNLEGGLYPSVKNIGLGNEIFRNDNVIIKLKEITSIERAVVEYSVYNDRDKTWSSYSSLPINKNSNEPKKIEKGDVSLRLVNVNADFIAKLKIVPEIKNGKTETDFIVQVGIEKRAIQLSPETAKKRIENLNKTLEKLEKATESLGNFIKAMKATCFATTVYLNVKNMFSNSGGQATARQYVMQSSGGWKEKCQKEMQNDETKYKSLDACYFANAEDIDEDVNKVADILNGLNEKISSSRGELTNEKEIANEFASSDFNNFINQNKDKTFTYGNKEIKFGDVFGNSGEKTSSMIEQGTLTIQDMRDIMFASELSKVDNIKEVGVNEMNKVITPLYTIQQNRAAEEEDKSQLQNLLGAQAERSYPIMGKEGIRVNVKISEVAGGRSNVIEAGKYVPVTYLSDTYIVPVISSGEGDYHYDSSKKIYDVNGREATDTEIKSQVKKITFVEITSQSCQNNYNVLNYKIGVYDTEPYKGLPKLVPFDLKQGWYIATNPNVAFLGTSSSAYTSSGMLSTFYLCNVGANNKEDFDKGIDDTCTRIDMNSNQPLDELPCLSKSEAINVIRKGVNTVQQISAAYAKGEKGINIDGKYFAFERAVSASGTQCQDFMSPKDCNLLFNVCDPVLCPSSRCNLGGAWQSNDVVQEGIIGGLLLCLPNFGKPSEGGVAIPVCLTGIHAGLEGWTSVIKAHRDCLQENIETGKMTGICDEIYSLYLCDFFWRQAAPLLRFGIPKLIESFVLGKSQGGGEYLTFQDSWKNMENSFNYFTNVYGVNAFQAFKTRSTGNIGTEICKSFVSANYPSSADTLNQLLSPESPVQFFARFDEIPYSDVTVNPTSQYKVYYHIYAGNDAGVYYSVYLKATSASSQYFNLQDSILVKTGYVAQGGYADETKDFTAPTGYDELCVRINDQEKCGFGQVTTEFAMNYVREQYVAEEASNKNINSEEECISGSSNVNSLINLNIQEGVSDYLNPDLSSLGITRVCSTGEPEGKTYSNSVDSVTWIAVGYCNKANGIICWADSRTIKNVIKNTDLENQTLLDLRANQNEIFKALGKDITIWDATAERNAKNNILNSKPREGEEPSQEYLALVNEFLQKAGNSSDKARILYGKFDIYNELTRDKYSKLDPACSTKEGLCHASPCGENLKTITGVTCPTDYPHCCKEEEKKEEDKPEEKTASNKCGENGGACRWDEKSILGLGFGGCDKNTEVQNNNFVCDNPGDICCVLKKAGETETSSGAISFEKDENDENIIRINLGWKYTDLFIYTKSQLKANRLITGANHDPKIADIFKQTFPEIKYLFKNLDALGIRLLEEKEIKLKDLEDAYNEYIKSLQQSGETPETLPAQPGAETPATATITNPDFKSLFDGVTQAKGNLLPGQKTAGERVLELAKQVKPDGADEKIKAETNGEIPSFECLVLMQTMAESSLWHCALTEGFRQASYNYSYCEGDYNKLNINRNSDEESAGIKQINMKAHTSLSEEDVAKFDFNAEWGTNYLKLRYDYCKTKKADSKNSWMEALTAYNTGSTCSDNSDYVKRVLAQRDIIANNFGECGAAGVSDADEDGEVNIQDSNSKRELNPDNLIVIADSYRNKIISDQQNKGAIFLKIVLQHFDDLQDEDLNDISDYGDLWQYLRLNNKFEQVQDIQPGDIISFREGPFGVTKFGIAVNTPRTSSLITGIFSVDSNNKVVLKEYTLKGKIFTNYSPIFRAR